MTKIAVFGAGGFARELAWLISEINETKRTYDFIGYLVSDLDRLTSTDSRNEVLGDLSWLDANRDQLQCLALGVGNPEARLRIAAEVQPKFPEIEWPPLIHPSVRFERESSRIGEGAILCAGVIGTVGLVIEPFTMVNLSCTLGHEAKLGKGSVLNPTVNISGGVELGEGVLVGTGAQILQYVHVGARAAVGAGAVVTKNVDAGQTVVGVPARPKS